MKKAWDIISTVLVWILVIVAVAMMIFTVVSVNTFDRNDRDLFGFKAFIVRSDSMSKTDFDAGDLILVKEVDPSTLKEGDIITYQSQGMENYGEIVTHKIRRMEYAPDGQPAFRTYGTTTDTDDPALVTYSFVLGKHTATLPKVGYFFDFLKTTPGYIVCILLPFLLLIGYQGLNCVKVFRLYKKEQMDELQAEKDAIAEERKKAEDMMAELMALKAQLANQQKEPGETETPAASSDEAAESQEKED